VCHTQPSLPISLRNCLQALGSFARFCASVSGSGNYNQTYDFNSVKRTAVVSVQGISGDAARDQIAIMLNQALLDLWLQPD
jgi:hypothetical protein